MTRSSAGWPRRRSTPLVDGLVEVDDDLLGALEGVGHGGTVPAGAGGV